MTEDELENFASDRTWGEDAYKGYLMAVEDIQNGTLKLAALSPAKQEWVKCSERMPELGDEYLVVWDIDMEKTVTVMEYDAQDKKFLDVIGFVESDQTKNVTHWMEYPALPGAD